MSKNVFDIQKEMTDAIVNSIESGNLPPWKCPWDKSGSSKISFVPYNASTQKDYSGVNVIFLWMKQSVSGYRSNAWLTYKQAVDLGGSVRRGEHGTHCIFYKLVEFDKKREVSAKSSETEDDHEKSKRFIANSFVVFNLDQIDGLGEHAAVLEPKQVFQGNSTAVIEEMTDHFCERTGLELSFGGDSAFYSPTFDRIQMPTSFRTEEGYCGTLAHELVHSTGHSSRLDRFAENSEGFHSKKESYAYEELIAEIGAAFICATLGIESDHLQHASYLDNWLNALKKDKTFLFRAAAAASKAQTVLMDGWNLDKSKFKHTSAIDHEEKLVASDVFEETLAV